MPNETGGPWVMGEPASNRAEHKCVDGATKYFRADICVACLTARLAAAEAEVAGKSSECIYCRDVLDVDDVNHWETCEKHPARQRLAAAVAERDECRRLLLEVCIGYEHNFDDASSDKRLRRVPIFHTWYESAARAAGGRDE